MRCERAEFSLRKSLVPILGWKDGTQCCIFLLHNVIDRAIQVHGAKGLTDDTPLSLMYRHAREARIYDGPDEVHVQSVAKRILRNYDNNGAGWDFGERDASLEEK